MACTSVRAMVMLGAAEWRGWHLVGISGGVGEEGTGDAREVVAELQAACPLVAVAANLHGKAGDNELL